MGNRARIPPISYITDLMFTLRKLQETIVIPPQLFYRELFTATKNMSVEAAVVHLKYVRETSPAAALHRNAIRFQHIQSEIIELNQSASVTI